MVCDARDLLEVQAGVRIGAAVAAGQSLARWLQAQPGNVCTPSYLAARAQQLATTYGFPITVLDGAALRAEGMRTLLAVAQGSVQDPRFILLEYRGAGDAAPVVLVGKGVTFDAGGISIKPAQNMEDMKFDMSGAAAVLGTFEVLGRLKPAVNVVGAIPATENLPSGTALKPGDVIRSHSGKTIEIINTDAEGRLILCDALSYVRRFKPAAVLDIATLTGAVVVALGHQATGIMGTDEALVAEVRDAGERAGERCWPLPLWDEYRDVLKSDIADVKNAGGRAAGTIAGGWFLREFAEGYPWVHLDIAGTAYTDSEPAVSGEGPDGHRRTTVQRVRPQTRGGVSRGVVLAVALLAAARGAAAQQDSGAVHTTHRDTTAAQDTTAARDTTTHDTLPHYLPVLPARTPQGPLPAGFPPLHVHRRFLRLLRHPDARAISWRKHIPGVYVARGAPVGRRRSRAVRGARVRRRSRCTGTCPLSSPSAENSVYLDVGRIPLAPLERVDVVVLPATLRVYLVTARQSSTATASAIGINTGVLSTTGYRADFLKRWKSGLGLSLLADWGGMTGPTSGSSTTSFNDVNLWFQGEYIPSPHAGLTFAITSVDWSRAASLPPGPKVNDAGDTRADEIARTCSPGQHGPTAPDHGLDPGGDVRPDSRVERFGSSRTSR